MKKDSLKYCLKLSFVFLLTLVVSCTNSGEKKDQEKKSHRLTEKEKGDLKPLKVENSEVIQKLRLNGKVEYDPNAVVPYTSMVGGVIVNTHVTLGDKVKKGRVLAEIKSVDLNSMETEVSQLERKLKIAERELETQKGFYEDGVASEKEFIETQSEKENLEAELNKLKSNLELFSGRSINGIFKIKAPQSGIIVENRMVAGMRFSEQDKSLFTISNLDKVWVRLNVYATEINFVKKGMHVNIKTNSYPDKVFDAEISRVSSIIDPEENVMKAWAVLDNEEAFLKPGLHIEAIVNAVVNDNKAPRLPASAVIFYGDKHYVAVIADGEIERREIEILYQDENSVYVKKGLEPGEEVVTENTLVQFEYARTRA